MTLEFAQPRPWTTGLGSTAIANLRGSRRVCANRIWEEGRKIRCASGTENVGIHWTQAAVPSGQTGLCLCTAICKEVARRRIGLCSALALHSKPLACHSLYTHFVHFEHWEQHFSRFYLFKKKVPIWIEKIYERQKLVQCSDKIYVRRRPGRVHGRQDTDANRGHRRKVQEDNGASFTASSTLALCYCWQAEA